jgi:DNA-binding transcriptional ArsR family regulator
VTNRASEQDTGSPSALRRLNLAHVLRVIRVEGPLPRSEVARLSGLSKPTVNEAAERLLADGLIIESMDSGSDQRRRPGPKARILRFNSRRWLVVGVDVGGAKILAVLSDLDGNILIADDPWPGVELVDGVQLPSDSPGLGVRQEVPSPR